MKTVLIEITEGCTSYSYTINGIEWVELTDTNSPNYTTKRDNIVLKVFDVLLGELCTQYDIPYFLKDCMFNNEEDNWEDVPCTQDMFINMVLANKRTTEKDLGHCDECGDDVIKYTLILEIE